MAAQNLLVEGIDLAGRDAVTGTQINQSVREATLESNLAWLIVDPAPDVASNTVFERFIKIDEAGSWFEYYDTGTDSWVDVPLPDGFVTADMIGDEEVNINKLDATGGSALQVIRVNASGTALEFADLEVDDSSVTVGKIVPGADPYMLMVTNDDNSAAVWMSATDLFVGVTKVVNLANVTQSSATTDDVPAWNGTNWVAAGVETLIPASSVALSKLTVGSGTALQVVRVNAGATAFETAALTVGSVTPGTANQFLQTAADGLTASWRTLFTDTTPVAMDFTVTTAHGLTYKPKIVECIVVPTASIHGYTTDDEIRLNMITGGSSGANFDPCAGITVDSTNFKVIFSDDGAARPTIMPKAGTGGPQTISDFTKYNVKFRYSNF